MITVKKFTTEILETHKGFFLLDQLPQNATEVDVWVQTLSGNESVDFVDVFSMADGSLLAAWQHPYQKLPLHNLQVFCDGKVQVLNLFNVERIWDIYDRPTNANSGTFIFCPSRVIPSGDWRCDRGTYGPKPFDKENLNRVITEIEEIVFFEPFMNVNGVGHIIYIESKSKHDFAHTKLNDSVVPCAGRTLQECLRLVYEWSVLAGEPFGSLEEAPLAASGFVKALGFSQEEFASLESLTPMQVSKFFTGSETARLRDMKILPLSKEVENMVFKRMASSSLSFIVSRNPHIGDLEQILKKEYEQLALGIDRFREYYKLPETIDIKDKNSVVEHVFIYFPKELTYVETQLRGFYNKSMILDRLWGGYDIDVY